MAATVKPDSTPVKYPIQKLLTTTPYQSTPPGARHRAVHPNESILRRAEHHDSLTSEEGDCLEGKHVLSKVRRHSIGIQPR
jgi:hypothetical protein